MIKIYYYLFVPLLVLIIIINRVLYDLLDYVIVIDRSLPFLCISINYPCLRITRKRFFNTYHTHLLDSSILMQYAT